MHQDHENLLPHSISDLNGVIRGTLDVVPFAYCLVSSPNFRYIFFNRPFRDFLRTLGLHDPDSALGKHAWDVTPDLWEALESVYEEAAAANKPCESRGLSVLSNGRELIVDVVVIPIVDEETGSVHAFAATIVDVTQERADVAVLAQSAELYRQIVETRCEGIWMLGPDSETTFVNARIAEMLGRPIEEMLGRSFFDFVGADSVDSAKLLWEGCLAGVSEQHDVRFHREDGTILWAIVVTDPVIDDEGEFVNAFAMVTDITERKKTEDALFASEEQFHRLVELAPNGIYMTDVDGKCIYVNRRWCEMAGMTPEQAIGDNWIAGLHPDDRATVAAEWNEMIDSNGHWGLEYRFITPDGVVTWVLGMVITLHDPSGKVTGYMGINTDITSRRKAEERARLLATIVENSSDFIGFANLDRQAVYLNKAGQALIGLQGDDEVRKIQIDDCLFAEDLPFVQENVLPTVIREGRWAGEFRFRHFKTGNAIDVLWDLFRVDDPQTGVPSGFATVTRDITERKKAETALKTSEAKYRQLYDTIVDAFASIDMGGNFVDYNEAYKNMLGYDSEELSKLTYKDITPEKWHDFEQDIIENQVLKVGHSQIYEKEYIRKDGTIFPVELRSLLLTDNSVKPTGMWAIVRDITARVQEKKMGDALNAINTAIASTLDYDEILQRVVREATDAIGTDVGFLVERSGSSWITKYAHRFPLDIIGKRYSDEEVGYTVIAAATKEALVVNDTGADGALKSMTSAAYDVRSHIVVPLLVRDEVIGALHFCYLHEPRMFTQAQIDFARKLATSVSLALGNAQLYEAERQAVRGEASAREILQRQFLLLQEALLPAEPTIGEGYSVAAKYIAALPGQEIGGDFYDIFKAESGKIGILVGDVSGKDVEAASLAADTRSTVRAFAYDMRSASAALEHTNAVLCGRPTTCELFVTIFLALLDLETGYVSYATAGHPPPAICRKGGPIEFLEIGSMPVGFQEGVGYKEHQTRLYPGDRLVIYTDGISDAHVHSDIFDQDGVARSLEDNIGAHPQKVIDDLIQAAKDWAGGTLVDDVAIVVVERAEC